MSPSMKAKATGTKTDRIEDHLANRKMPSDMPLPVKCFTWRKNINMISVLSYDWIFWEIDFLQLLRLQILLFLYAFTWFRVIPFCPKISQQWPKLLLNIAESIHFAHVAIFTGRAKLRRKKTVNAPSAVVVKQKYFNMNIENHDKSEIMCLCVFCQTEWHIVKYSYAKADGS